jgi:hypothetical protein
MVTNLEGITESDVLVSAGATATGTYTITNERASRLVVVLNTAVASGGNTVQVTINGVTQQGFVYPILVGIAVAAAVVTPYRVGPALTPSANAVSNDVVPRTIQIVATVAGTVSYGIDYILGT